MSLYARHRRLLIPVLMVAAAAVLVAWGPPALAQDGFGLDRAANAGGIAKNADLAKSIGNIIRIALGLVGTIFLVLMVYAGFQWMTARGDSKKVEDARNLITGAVVGVIIVASAYAITSFVLSSVTKAGQKTTTNGSP
jgi:hypothetical protein